MILEAIFNGNFYPSETVVPKSEKYRNALKACEKIMDQLEEAGVVGPEEGTKPRRVLMSPEELQTYLDENV